MSVTWEDQQAINSFGRLTAKLRELEAEQAVKKVDHDNLTEALNDLMEMQLGGGLDDAAADDEDLGGMGGSGPAGDGEAVQSVHYWLGDIMVEMPLEEAEKRIEAELSDIDKHVSTISTEMISIQKTLAQLKVTLYAKFGHDNINLDA